MSTTTNLEKAIALIEDALEGTAFDDMGNRDDDGLRFAAQMGWLPPEQRKSAGKLSDALKLLKEHDDE